MSAAAMSSRACPAEGQLAWLVAPSGGPVMVMPRGLAGSQTKTQACPVGLSAGSQDGSMLRRGPRRDVHVGCGMAISRMLSWASAHPVPPEPELIPLG